MVTTLEKFSADAARAQTFVRDGLSDRRCAWARRASPLSPVSLPNVYSALRASRSRLTGVHAAAVASLVLAPHRALAQERAPAYAGGAGDTPYTAPREAAVDARGARRLRVEGHAGFLRVHGVEGLTAVRVRGTARASRPEALPAIRLVARRDGDVVTVRADLPDGAGEGGGPDGDWRTDVRALDLTLEVPRGIAADVTDGSGELAVRGVGALDVTDGSGGMTLEDVGPTRVEDGSGEIRVEDVRGDLRVADGSGDIAVRRVRGSVTVERAGSGGVDVRDVDGDLTVERGRTRGVAYAGVRGRVTVPSDGRDRGADRGTRRSAWY